MRLHSIMVNWSKLVNGTKVQLIDPQYLVMEHQKDYYNSQIVINWLGFWNVGGVCILKGSVGA